MVLFRLGHVVTNEHSALFTHETLLDAIVKTRAGHWISGAGDGQLASPRRRLSRNQRGRHDRPNATRSVVVRHLGAEDFDRLVDHPRGVLNHGSQTVGWPGGRRDVVETRNEDILRHPETEIGAQRVHRPHGHKIVGAEQSIRRPGVGEQGERRRTAALVAVVSFREGEGLDPVLCEPIAKAGEPVLARRTVGRTRNETEARRAALD